MSWEDLKRIYRDKGLVLVLGSGVSIDSSLPNWFGLLRNLINDSIGQDNASLFDELRDRDIALPTIASMVEQQSSDKKASFERRREFIEGVRTALYRDFCLPLRANMNSEHNQRKLVDDVCERNPNNTLRAVAALCVVPADERKQTYKDNLEGVRAIVTFNLDSLLQEYIRARYNVRRNGRPYLRTVERASASSSTKRINIYHMHGLLRFDSKAEDPKKEAPDAVVLTEQDYFTFFNDPTSLFNYTFLHLLREFSCLFIGLSMQDENIRRLLHYSYEERMRSFRNEGEEEPEARRRSLRHFAILKHYDSALIDRSVEDSLLALGTRVLWIDGFGDIRYRLGEIYSPASGDWDLVF